MIKLKKLLKETSNAKDTITVDVPLFIRLLEFAREDANTDMDLHALTEKCLSIGKSSKTLTMSDYNKLINRNGSVSTK